MPFVKIKPLAEFPAGSLAQMEINGAAYALCHHPDGTLRVFDGLCPHAGAPLGEGNLDGDQLVCPWHGWAFDCKTGINDFDPDIELKSYPVEIKEGSIFAELP